MKRKRRQHTSTDKAVALAKLISQPIDTETNSKNISSLFRNMQINVNVGRKEQKTNERIHDKTPDDSIH